MAPEAANDETFNRSRTISSFDMSHWNKMAAHPQETLRERFERYSIYFSLNDVQLKDIEGALGDELRQGLEAHKASPKKWRPELCSLMMLDTCCGHNMPTGAETGVYYGIDFGGTNLRVVRVCLKGKGEVEIQQRKKNLREMVSDQCPKGLLDKNATASELFDALANDLKSFIIEKGDHKALRGGEKIGVGFTFSFGMEQDAIASARLITWTKEFETGRKTDDRVEGQDVCMLLDCALERNKVPAKCQAVLNDTTGTLLCSAYEKPDGLPTPQIGLILGTGINGCYRELDAAQYGYQGCIINTEIGGCDSGLPRNDIDLTIDFESTTRGMQLFEKMTSGQYLGEVGRMLILRVYQNRAPEIAWTKGSLSSEVMAQCVADPSTKKTEKAMTEIWRWSGLDQEDYVILRQLMWLVFDRGCSLAACGIVALSRRTGKMQRALGGVTVGIDGALWCNNPWYQSLISQKIDIILGPQVAKLIHLMTTSDGSGKGAGLLAMAVAAEKRS